jgi:hypothetical protein
MTLAGHFCVLASAQVTGAKQTGWREVCLRCVCTELVRHTSLQTDWLERGVSDQLCAAVSNLLKGVIETTAMILKCPWARFTAL